MTFLHIAVSICILTITPMVGARTSALRPYCDHGSVPLRCEGDVVMRIETQQKQSGWAMEGRTAPRSAAMDTFR